MKNKTFNPKFAVSKFLNAAFFTDPQDYKKAAKIYTEFNYLRKFAILEYYKILLYKDFVKRVNISKWKNQDVKTHLLNILHSIHNNSI